MRRSKAWSAPGDTDVTLCQAANVERGQQDLDPVVDVRPFRIVALWSCHSAVAQVAAQIELLPVILAIMPTTMRVVVGRAGLRFRIDPGPRVFSLRPQGMKKLSIPCINLQQHAVPVMKPTSSAARLSPAVARA
jgi:hypothetical protein